MLTTEIDHLSSFSFCHGSSGSGSRGGGGGREYEGQWLLPTCCIHLYDRQSAHVGAALVRDYVLVDSYSTPMPVIFSLCF